MDSREHIRTLFANLLAADAPADVDGGAPEGFDDPFGEELFSERAFQSRGEHTEALLGEGFEGLRSFDPASGDGHGRGPATRDTPAPVWMLSATDEQAMPLDADPFVDEPVQDDVFSTERSFDPALALDGTFSPVGTAPSLGALPERPSAGAQRVVMVAADELERLNGQLDAGWRIVQLLPGPSSAAFVVALRYAGCGA